MSVQGWERQGTSRGPLAEAVWSQSRRGTCSQGLQEGTGDRSPVRRIPGVTSSLFPLLGPGVPHKTTVGAHSCLVPLTISRLQSTHTWCPSCATHLETNLLKLPGTVPFPYDLTLPKRRVRKSSPVLGTEYGFTVTTQVPILLCLSSSRAW